MDRPRDTVGSRPPLPSGAETAWFGGSLSGLSFGEVLQLLGVSLRSGVLTVEVGAAPLGLQRKTVWLRDGQVVFAASSDPADHLGSLLWRRGIVPEPDLDRCAPKVRAGRPLGQVLVDEGLLTAAALYDALVEQVREIVLGAFHERRGVFVFHDRPEQPNENAVQLPDRTPQLVAAGVRRQAEIERLAASLPDPDEPLATPAGAPEALEGRAARLLEAVQGAGTAREAFRASGLGFYEGMKVLATLARAGLVEGSPAPPQQPPPPAVAPPPAAEPAGAAEPLETYRRIFKRVFFRLAHAAPAAPARINSWIDRLDDAERAIFDGVRMDPEGEVDVTRVLVNVIAAGREEGPAARARALAALDSFLAFALFEARNLLEPADADALARDVARMQGRRTA